MPPNRILWSSPFILSVIETMITGLQHCLPDMPTVLCDIIASFLSNYDVRGTGEFKRSETFIRPFPRCVEIEHCPWFTTKEKEEKEALGRKRKRQERSDEEGDEEDDDNDEEEEAEEECQNLLHFSS